MKTKIYIVAVKIGDKTDIFEFKHEYERSSYLKTMLFLVPDLDYATSETEIENDSN